MQQKSMNAPSFLKINGSHYTILGELGSGSYGVVYKAENNLKKQIVAIKVQGNVEESEFKIIDKFKNQKFANIVNIYDYEKIKNKHYIVMDYCDASLYQQIQKKTIEPKNLRYVISQIAHGIKEMHNQGLAHRDLKPENILIQTQSSEGRNQEFYKICDFGTSKEIQRLQTKQVGTPYYLAPEQLGYNFNSYTQSVDIWAFGAVIYELLTNVPLFNGTTIDQVTKQIIELDIPKKIDSLQILENEYKELLKQMLQRDPKKRISIEDIIKRMSQRRSSVAKRTNNKIEKEELKLLQLKPLHIVNQNSQQPQSQFEQLKPMLYNQMPNAFQAKGPIYAFQLDQNNQNNGQIQIQQPNQQQIKQVQGNFKMPNSHGFNPNPIPINPNPSQFNKLQDQFPQQNKTNQVNFQQQQVNQVNVQPNQVNQVNPKPIQGNQNFGPSHKPVQSDNFQRGNRFNQSPNQFPIKQFLSQDRK